MALQERMQHTLVVSVKKFKYRIFTVSVASAWHIRRARILLLIGLRIRFLFIVPLLRRSALPYIFQIWWPCVPRCPYKFDKDILSHAGGFAIYLCLEYTTELKGKG